VPVEFPQEFLLVDRVTVLFCPLNGTRLVELDLFFFFGHGWGEKGERREWVS